MCRWLAYFGTPVHIEDLVLNPTHSLIDQSLNARFASTTTNGDGFGIGWYDRRETPALFRSVGPAWSDRNLKDLAHHVASPLVFAHVRASTGTPTQQTNCHPFRYGRWLWMHNGQVFEFDTLKRDLLMAVEPSLFRHIEGSTDSELFFYLALTFGLERDPPGAVQRAVGLIEETARRHGIAPAVTLTVATSNGERTWAFRYSSDGDSRSLYYSTRVETLREQFPDNPIFERLSDETRLIVSEPLGDLAGAWQEFPESSWFVVQPGPDELHHFTPESVELPAPNGR
ncbi:MAG: class II glutamine amidotransferase [Gammaproteobacteria bacterium]|nr:class II glutamine amidotransferase [Gammaproteobacteria bacterium]